MSRYAHPSMKKLTDRQLRYAPRDVRLRQIEKAENLLDELAPEEEYHYRDICERITSFRPDMESDMLLSGEEVVHDLRCFVEDLSDSADIPIEAVEEPVYTVKDLSERYNVSTKTVDRWRDRGLGQPAVQDRQPQAGGLFEILRGPVRRAAFRRNPPGQQVQPAFRRRTRSHHPPRPPDGPLWRMPGGNQPAFGKKIGTLCGGHSLHIEKLRPRTSGIRGLPAGFHPHDRRTSQRNFSQLPPRRAGRRVGQPLLPDQIQRVSDRFGSPGRAAAGTAHRLYGQRRVPHGRRRRADSDDPAGRQTGLHHAGAAGIAALFGEPVFDSAVDQGRGSLLLPQDELLEVQSRRAAGNHRSPAAQDPRHEPDRRIPRQSRRNQKLPDPLATCGWWFRSPNGTSSPRATSSKWSATGTCP